jgi:hypothetical protein
MAARARSAEVARNPSCGSASPRCAGTSRVTPHLGAQVVLVDPPDVVADAAYVARNANKRSIVLDLAARRRSPRGPSSRPSLARRLDIRGCPEPPRCHAGPRWRRVPYVASGRVAVLAFAAATRIPPLHLGRVRWLAAAYPAERIGIGWFATDLVMARQAPRADCAARATGSVVLVIAGISLGGWCFGHVQPSLMSVVSGAAPDNELGVATSLQQTANQVGSVFGSGLLAAIAADAARPTPFVAAYLVAAGLSVAAGAVVFPARGQRGRGWRRPPGQIDATVHLRSAVPVGPAADASARHVRRLGCKAPPTLMCPGLRGLVVDGQPSSNLFGRAGPIRAR